MFKWIKHKRWSAASCELIFVCVCLLLTPLNPAIYLRDGPRASARDARLMCTAHGGTRHHGSLLGRYVCWRFFFWGGGQPWTLVLQHLTQSYWKIYWKETMTRPWHVCCRLELCKSLQVFNLLTEMFAAAPCPWGKKSTSGLLFVLFFLACCRVTEETPRVLSLFNKTVLLKKKSYWVI